MLYWLHLWQLDNPWGQRMDAYDDSLKLLISEAPAEFFRFGLSTPDLKVYGPLETALPSPGRRDVDACYELEIQGLRCIGHVEFHRRHQSLEELARDVAEAQLRLYLREERPVLSLVWDLYGKRRQPTLKPVVLAYGAPVFKKRSQSVYVRVNLRGMDHAELLALPFPALWPLAPLTSSGATEEVVRQTRHALESVPGLTTVQRANRESILWFVAESEGLTLDVLERLFSEEELMQSTLFQRAERRGEQTGALRRSQEILAQLLAVRMGSIDPAVRERIHNETTPETLEAWLAEAMVAADAETARRLADKIRSAPGG
jgi:hypothetical protein